MNHSRRLLPKELLSLVEQNVSQALKASTTASVLLEGRAVLTGKSDELSHEAIKNAYFGIDVA